MKPGCALCHRNVKLTAHHVVPRQYGGEETVDICRGCHSQIHALYTNRTLAEELNSLEALRQAPEMKRYLRWIRKQGHGKIKVRKANRKR